MDLQQHVASQSSRFRSVASQTQAGPILVLEAMGPGVKTQAHWISGGLRGLGRSVEASVEYRAAGDREGPA